MIKEKNPSKNLGAENALIIVENNGTQNKTNNTAGMSVGIILDLGGAHAAAR
ncbi:hypothetical protein ACINWCA157_1444 [Acinetobacter radioresistens WC-A-157]|nr:hypothetical protein ACINWCA157_1444 [Acinetobacter radioresistens WC-A-157]